ncbi:MAG: RPA family protein, partial [Halanaeroarchaeum sp.]
MSAERPQREVAYRLFAAEFDDADFTYAESDEERAPNYVVTPTGARVNRMFVVGVLTEVEQVSDDVLRARIVDPTGAFVVYAGQYQPEAMAFFDRAEPPAFVAVTGKARTFQPDDSEIVYTSIRPESANEVTAETRDRWVVQTAEQTLDRIETFAGAIDLAERGDALTDALSRRGIRPGLAAGIPKAMDHYGTTTGYLAEMRRVAIDAARVVANELDEVASPGLAPDEGADRQLDFDATLPASEFASSDEPETVGADSESEAMSAAEETDAEPAEDAAGTEPTTEETDAESADDVAEPGE